MSTPGRRARAGSSLLELLIALLIFQVGLLGVAGMLLTAQRVLGRSQLIMRGTLALVRTGDSLQAEAGAEGGAVAAGEKEEPWGTVSWLPGGEGELHLLATGGEASDTLSSLTIWPPPESLSFSGDSPGGAGAPTE